MHFLLKSAISFIHISILCTRLWIMLWNISLHIIVSIYQSSASSTAPMTTLASGANKNIFFSFPFTLINNQHAIKLTNKANAAFILSPKQLWGLQLSASVVASGSVQFCAYLFSSHWAWQRLQAKWSIIRLFSPHLNSAPSCRTILIQFCSLLPVPQPMLLSPQVDTWKSQQGAKSSVLQATHSSLHHSELCHCVQTSIC